MHVLGAVTLCARGCNPMCLQAATLCTQVSEGQPLLRFALQSSEAGEQQRSARDWADAHRRRRLADAEEAQQRFEQWQV